MREVEVELLRPELESKLVFVLEFEVEQQVAQSGLDQAFPAVERVLVFAEDLDFEEVVEVVEEGVGEEEVFPAEWSLPLELVLFDESDDFVGFAEVVVDDLLLHLRDVVGGVHLGEGGRDDQQQPLAVFVEREVFFFEVAFAFGEVVQAVLHLDVFDEDWDFLLSDCVLSRGTSGR